MSPKFVVHEHDASHLHWDLRLEEKGVLKSWAVPKVPPKTRGTKRLMIQVEDHALKYASFEGTIPKGHYGAGSVKIWDSGTYKALERDAKKWLVEFKGKKLKGEYVVLKFPKSGPKGWLLFKT